MSIIGKLIEKAHHFVPARRGNVAMIFALALVPLMLATCGALDFARAIMVRANMAEALDAAALAVGATRGLSQTEMEDLARKYFEANYHEDKTSYGTPTEVQVTPSGQSVVLATSNAMPTTILKAVGVNTMNVAVSTTVVWGQSKLWVALVLDNTGSMCQSDKYPNAGSPCATPNPGSKIAVLKNALNGTTGTDGKHIDGLLDMLKNVSSSPGDVKVSIIPFVKDVNVDSTNVNASWLDWTDWNSLNGTCSGYGSNGSTKSICIVAHCSKSQYTSKSDCEGNWHNGTWYNAGTWTPSNHSNWKGCVTDRGKSTGPDGDYDVQNYPPVAGTPSSLFPAEQYSSCPKSLMGLSDDWTTLGNKVSSMTAAGSTNQTIGLVWGWHSLSEGDPLNSGTLPSGTARYIILLSDGLNTQDRWYGDGVNQSSAVDNRMASVCNNIKTYNAGLSADNKDKKITIYAVFVDIGGTQGNSTVLQNCATAPDKYKDLKSAADITTALHDIGIEITNLFIAR